MPEDERKSKVKRSINPKADDLEPNNQSPVVMINKNKFDAEKVERKNKLIMWVGISCIMAAFVVAWIFNLKHEFRASANKSSPNKLDWVQIRAELDKTMKQVKQSIAEIKQTQQNASSTPFKESELTAEQINLLKEKLLNETASTTASSTVKN